MSRTASTSDSGSEISVRVTFQGSLRAALQHVGDGLAHGGRDVVLEVLGHVRIERNREQARGGVLGLRQRDGAELAHVAAELVGRGIDRGLNAVLVAQAVAHGLAGLGLHQNAHEVARGARLVVPAVGDAESLDVVEQLAVARDQLAPAFDLRAQASEARPDDRRAQVVEAVVEADLDHVVAHGGAAMAVHGRRGHPLRAQAADPLGDLVGVGAERAALPHAQDLVRKEREAAGQAVGAELLRAVVGPGSVGGVLDQGQAPALAELGEIGDLDRIARPVDRDHGLGALGDERLDRFRVHVQVVALATDDVAEDGPGAAVADGVGGRDEGERRDDHLVARLDPRGDAGEVERSGAAREASTCFEPRCSANSCSNASV